MNKFFENKIRVRYGETDQMGVVYYGNYALYLEEARTELIRSLGISYKNLEIEGIMLPVNNLNIKYLKSAKYDDVLLLKTRVKEPISRKIIFQTDIFNQDIEKICEAEVTLLFVNSNRQKIISCPLDLKHKLESFYVAF